MKFKKQTGLVLELQKHTTVSGRRFLANSKVSAKGIASVLGISYQAVNNKLDRNFFLVDEAIKIRNALFPDLTIEYLFEEQDDL